MLKVLICIVAVIVATIGATSPPVWAHNCLNAARLYAEASKERIQRSNSLEERLQKSNSLTIQKEGCQFLLRDTQSTIEFLKFCPEYDSDGSSVRTLKQQQKETIDICVNEYGFNVNELFPFLNE